MLGTLALLTTLLADPAAEARALVEEAGQARAIGHIDEALELLEKARSLDRSPQLLNNIGVVMQEIGRYADAARAFQQVIDDPNAPAELRALDRERRRSIEPKLTSAHVLFEGEGAEVSIDGTSCVSSGRETPVAPGVRWIEQWSRDATIAAVWSVDLVAGRRTVLPLLAAPPSARAPVGAVTFPVDGPTEVVVDAIPLARAFASGTASVVLRPGRHHLVLRKSGGAPALATVEIVAGQSIRAEAAPVAAPPVAVVAPIVEDGSPWLRYALAGAGSAALVAAGVLLAQAASDRAAVYEATVDSGVIVSISQVEAASLAASARTLDIAAIVSGVAGAALLVVAALGVVD